MHLQCSEETLVRFFYNVSSSFFLLFLFFYFTSITLSKIFHYCGSPIFQRSEDEYDIDMLSDEEEEEEVYNGYYCHDYAVEDHLVADITSGSEAPHFSPSETIGLDVTDEDAIYEEAEEEFQSPASESDSEEEDEDKEEIPMSYVYPGNNFPTHNGRDRRPIITMDVKRSVLVSNDENRAENRKSERKEKEKKVESDFTRDEKFLIFAPPKLETKKIHFQEADTDHEEIFGDSCTNGSTSKSSTEWRSSIYCRDSGTEDPFSSSSRRSCPKWESYTVFQKYDEEMLFLDRISAQKLQETESLRSIQACPRSISERIVHKLAPRNNKKSSHGLQNSFQELEAAYVAQICLTWEALNWNYKHYQCLRASRKQSDPGCPAYIAQQFQQFLVLLQRYVENEPYERGKRPEIYARRRSLAPKLLQVPEYRDSNDEEKEEDVDSRFPSDSFLEIMEEAIRTFLSFLKADRKSHCEVLTALFKRNRRGSVDPRRILLLKKINQKKKLKIKDISRSGKCIRKRKLNMEQEMEILMALIDMKVVSRVLRMSDLNEEQLHWCDDKMNKVRVADGKLKRDSSPLFFPAH